MRVIESRKLSFAGRYTCGNCGTIIELDDLDKPTGKMTRPNHVGGYGTGTPWEITVPTYNCPGCLKPIEIRGESIPAIERAASAEGRGG